MIWQKINYIHANPVKARLVSSARDYRWSSFNAFYSGSEEPLKVDQEWWWSDDAEKLSKAMKELGSGELIIRETNEGQVQKRLPYPRLGGLIDYLLARELFQQRGQAHLPHPETM